MTGSGSVVVGIFANKKERGIEVWITRLTAILSVAFFVLAICAAFFVERL